jgi:hypothetical protein
MNNDTEPGTYAPELRLLADLRRRHAVPDGDAADRMRHVILHATTYHSVIDGRGSRTVRPPRRRRVLVGAAAAAVALSGALGVAAVASHRPDGTAPVVAGDRHTGMPAIGDHDNARLVLALAARTTQTEPAASIRPGQYVYRKTTELAVATYSFGDKNVNVYEEQRHEMWLDPRHGLQPVRIVQTTGLNRKPVTPADAALAAQVGFDLNAPPVTSDSDKPVKGGPGIPAPAAQPPSLRYPTPEYLAGLTTDPARLLALLRRAAKAEGNTKWSTDKIAFQIVGDLFEQGDPIIPAALRAGLYRAIALMPGIQRIEGQTDFGGRRGVAIGFAEGGQRQDILLDPTTLHPIGNRLVRVPAAGVESWSAFTFTIVNQPGKTN